MTFITLLRFILPLFALLTFSHSTVGQIVTETFPVKTDSLDVFFEKIVLDGHISYRNESTNEIISEQDYITLCGADTHVHDQFTTHDYWLCDRVNPYHDVDLPTPFMISFDQTHFTHPVDGEIVITSRFGRRRRGPHRGLDIDLVTGDIVRSVLPGKVRFVGYSRGHGKTVVVRHANEVETVYAHLSAYDVKVNDIISEGQIIGKGGNTGNSRGSHLHLEVRYKGVCIHPEYVFNFDGSQSIRSMDLWVTNGWKSPRMHSSYRESDLTPLVTESDAIASQDAEPRYHRVVRGDTLSGIARSYSLGLKDLCDINRISKNSILRIGQVIQVR